MNIFEFLGLPSDHRKNSNKVTQLVKHWDEVPESRKSGKEYGVQLKLDGVCALLVFAKGEARLFSRTGKEFTNTEHITNRVHGLGLHGWPDAVYFGELYVNKDVDSLEVLSGIVNPNRVTPLDAHQGMVSKQLKLGLFDMVLLNDFIKGSSEHTFEARHRRLLTAMAYTPEDYAVQALPYVRCKTEEEIELLCEKLVLGGNEGIVAKDLNANWEAGHKGWRAMKMVRGVDYDLRCIDYEEGTGKYKGKVANLIFEWKNGETIKCMLGKGWTHCHAEAMYHAINFSCVMEGADDPIGKIFQVYALEESSKGKLRLPKVGELRHDKEEADVI